MSPSAATVALSGAGVTAVSSLLVGNVTVAFLRPMESGGLETVVVRPNCSIFSRVYGSC
jgi:hypothetical protein